MKRPAFLNFAFPLLAAGVAIALWNLPMATLGAADIEPVEPTPTEAPQLETTTSVADPRPRRVGDVIKIFGSAHVRPHETADQVVVLFGDARIEGRVRDQVVVVFGNATITEDVGDQVVCVFGRLTIGPGVHIGDQVVAIGGASVDQSVEIGDQLYDFPLPNASGLTRWVRECLLWGRLYPHDHRATWWFAGVMLLFNLAFATVFRRAVDGGVRALESRPAATFFNGLMGAVLLGPIVVLLAFTIVGVIAMPFVFAATLFATVLGVVGVYRHCGAQLGLAGRPWLALVVGHVLFAALYAVPVVGLSVWALTMMLGLGVALTTWSDERGRERRPHRTLPAPPPPPSVPAPSPAPTAPLVEPASEASVTPTPTTTAGSPPLPPPPVPVPAPHVVTPVSALHATGIHPRVDLWPRLLAAGLDFLLVFFAAQYLNIEEYLLFVWFTYHVAFWTWRSTTLGGIVLNLRIERLDGRPFDFGTAFVRALGSVFSALPLGLGFWSVQWDPEKQSWHDKIAGTTIVRVPRGQPLV